MRAHWTDEQVRHRSGSESRHAANFEDYDLSGDEGLEEWSEEFFQDWAKQEISMLQDAQAEADSALRKEGALCTKPEPGRKKYTWAADSSAEKAEAREDAIFQKNDRMQMDKAHACGAERLTPPDSAPKGPLLIMARRFYMPTEMLFGDHVEEGYLPAEERKSTHAAMTRGYGVLDAGATRTMGSIVALEHARQVSLRESRICRTVLFLALRTASPVQLNSVVAAARIRAADEAACTCP